MCLYTKLIRNHNGGKVKPNRAEPSVAIQMSVASLTVIVAARQHFTFRTSGPTTPRFKIYMPMGMKWHRIR